MDHEIIKDCTDLSLNGKITFPEVVSRMASTGVERYLVDLIGMQKMAYGVNGDYYSASLVLEKPLINAVFSGENVGKAVKSIQQGQIKYLEFLDQITKAGCSHYEVYISGRKVCYFGRKGEQHMEYFPS